MSMTLQANLCWRTREPLYSIFNVLPDLFPSLPTLTGIIFVYCYYQIMPGGNCFLHWADCPSSLYDTAKALFLLVLKNQSGTSSQVR